jgi:Ca2+-binding EF-hand superfamily protein
LPLHQAENRSKYVPYEPESQADSIRYWRKQARDESGRAVMARTLENAYVQEWQRSSKPDAGASYMTKPMVKNVQRMRQANDLLRRSRTNPLTNKEPLSDSDLMEMCTGVVAEGKRGRVQRWLATANVVEKEQFRQLLVNLKRQDTRHRYVRAEILDLSKEERPATQSSSRGGTTYGRGNETLKYRDSVQDKILGRLRGHYSEVMKMFQVQDPDRLGHVTLETFISVLAGFHVPLTPQETEVMVMFFENESGMILYREFLDTMLPRTSDVNAQGQHSRSALPPKAVEQFSAGAFHEAHGSDQILDELRAKILNLGGQNLLQTTFRRFDIDGNGKVDLGEMLEVLHSFGILVNAEQVEKLMAIFDPDKSGSVGLAIHNPSSMILSQL